MMPVLITPVGNNAATITMLYHASMAKRLDYTRAPRANQTFVDDDLGETDTSYGKIKDRHRLDIQRNYPDLTPGAVEVLLRKRMARGYRPYRPTA